MLTVTFRTSGFAGRRLELSQPVLRLGRDPACEVLFDELADRVVSRVHAEIRWHDDGLPWLHPNGERLVFRRGARIAGPVPLAPGDLVELAGVGGPSVEVTFTPPVASEAPTPPAVPFPADPLSVLRSLDAPATLYEPAPTGAHGGVLDLPTSVLSLPSLEPRPAPRAALQPLPATPAVVPLPAPPPAAPQLQTSVLSLAELQRVAADAAGGPPQRPILLGTIAPPAAVPTPESEQRTSAYMLPRMVEPTTDPNLPAVSLPPAAARALPTLTEEAAEASTELALRPIAAVAVARPDGRPVAPPPAVFEGATSVMRVPVPPAPLPVAPLEPPTDPSQLAVPLDPAPPATTAAMRDPAERTLPLGPGAPPPRRRGPVVPPLEAADASSTMMIPAYMAPGLADAGSGSSTQFLRLDQLPLEEDTPPPPSRRPLYLLIGAAALVLVLAVGAYSIWVRSERARIAIAKIERMRATLLELEQAGRKGDAEYREIEAEIAREAEQVEPSELPAARQAAPAKAPPDPAALEAERVAAAKAKEEKQAKEEAARQAREQVLARLRDDARTAFALVKAKELELLAVPRSKRAPIAAKRLEHYKAYVAARAALALPNDGIAPLIRRTAAWLGECDALVPPKFVEDVKEAIAKLKAPGRERDAFIEAVRRGDGERFAQTITAALADNGLPVELYFLAWWTSSLDPKFVGAAEPRGVPKGMWQLLPAFGEKLGLTLGPSAKTAAYDPADERHLFEKETKVVARHLRDVYRKRAAGSALLLAASWDHGDPGLLAQMKRDAGLAADETDPARTSFRALYEAGALGDDRRRAAAQIFAAVLVAAEPRKFGFAFDVPIRHVDAVETK